MEVKVRRITDWSLVLDSARTTVGKDDVNKEPSDEFKRSILIAEHSPIRNLWYEVIWTDIPYWVSMHLRTHHCGFHSGEDDTVFISSQRSDRTGVERDKLPQDEPVTLRVVMNAHSIINISRVRLCRKASLETREAWDIMLCMLSEIEPILASVCVPNCIYRDRCPEIKCCGFIDTYTFENMLDMYDENFKE